MNNQSCYHQVKGDSIKFCSTYVCDSKSLNRIDGGSRNDYYTSCNGKYDCKNTLIDEDWDCANEAGQQQYQCLDNRTKLKIATSKLCDKKCDCQFCDDESECNGVKYGLTCKSKRVKKGNYVPPAYVCDNEEECEDGSDEANCTNSDRSCILPPMHSRYNKERNGVRYLRDVHSCAVPYRITVCVDGLDQVNCTDPDRVAMWCLNEGYNTSISIFAVCKGYSLCDDDYNNKCLEPEGGCYVHKNMLCDGKEDCPGGADEADAFCKHKSKVRCIRRVGGSNKEFNIPLNWVFDGEVDCVDRKDEDETYWKKCGSWPSVRYFEKGRECKDQLKCPGEGKFVDFKQLCDRVESCGRESDICSVSRNIPKTWNKLTKHSSNDIGRTMSYCINGLEDLRTLSGNCRTVLVSNNNTEKVSLIEASTAIMVPTSKPDCRFVYGEMLIYLACTDSCLQLTPCPLRKIPHDTCVNKIKARVFAVTVNNELTVVLKRGQETYKTEGSREKNKYHNELFPCDNKKCVLYSEVCNLADDCGDGSDEINCTNHFFCPGSKECIPLSSKCDGQVDCRDYSDECNRDCDISERFILQNLVLRWLSWIIGSLAILFNAFNIFTSGHEMRGTKTFQGFMNKSFIILISLGDFLMGIYLTLIAYADMQKGSDYCMNKHAWLSSLTCSLLGILSTIATQLSLFSMTGLSLFRIVTIEKIIPRSISSRSILDVIMTITGIFALSATVACVPLIATLEDFFVNGLYYHGNPLFTGSVSKSKHYQIFESYFGHFKDVKVSWSAIRLVVKSMFTNEYGGKLLYPLGQKKQTNYYDVS